MSLQLAEKYIDDVLSGRILTCIPVRQAVERHVADLKRSDIYFDHRSANKALTFFSFLRHSKGKWAGQPFELSPWQAFIVYCLFGWKRADGSRRYRYAYIEVPRKSGKTTFAAGVALYMLIADGEAGAEIYTGATTRDQAKICFSEAQSMVRKAPAGIAKRATVYAHNIHVTATASKMEPVSSDYNVLDGLNPHCVVLDELHAYKDSGLFDIFSSATGARWQPLIFMITTAGFNKTWFCYQYRKYVLSVLSGRLTDDSLFGMIYTLDEGDDWSDERVWVKANPNLGISIFTDYLKERVNTALQRPSEQVNVKTKNLNVWTDASDVWIPDHFYSRGSWGGFEAEEELSGFPFYAGLDLASTADFTAWSMFFPLEDGSFETILRCWIPEETVERRISGGLADLREWIRLGLVRVTPGSVTDYGRVKADILADCEKFDLRSIAIDGWNSSHLVQELDDELGKFYRNGEYVSRLSKFGQGFRSMGTPTKEFERLMLLGQIGHGGNPVLRWMLSNVELDRDAAGNIKPDKAKSSEKIDGVVASIMALGEFLQWNWKNEKSTYEERGLRTVGGDEDYD